MEPPFPEVSRLVWPAPAPGDVVAELTLPAERYVGVARLVVAGVAARLDLRFEDVDDLQLALESVLRIVFDSSEQATVSVAVDDETVAVSIGPGGRELLEQPLADDAPRESIDL